MTTICVSTHDLRRACTAVVPHANPKIEILDRVRFTIDPHNITLTATDGWTSGLAIVSIWETENDIIPIPEDGILVDLASEQIRKILSVFKAPADKGDEPEAILQIEVGDNYVKIADVSGLPGIDGQALELPRMDTYTGFADVAHTISRIRCMPETALTTVNMSPKIVSAFTAAAKAYNETIQITAHSESRTLTVVIGESFLGLLTPVQLTDEERARHLQWADAWDVRLPAADSLPRNATKDTTITSVLKEGAGLLVEAGVTSISFSAKDGDQ
ncbi:hypothetical protein BO226_19400 [Rhodococcus sp. 2G]|uniref:hypothetical protein n=1 Tax=Rhodococcus sp. 2G TaxID=1570939 RepID=UPI0009034928|nr:hypothetical protein [Rhodococcus sp. 2G]APE11041.1 hypothetical protein BO226_19070 [Rhodococcus sp. 2G]APE11097.1 hypothetical protein BO226_19400 [Rhodococcus sp. 2G]